MLLAVAQISARGSFGVEGYRVWRHKPRILNYSWGLSVGVSRIEVWCTTGMWLHGVASYIGPLDLRTYEQHEEMEV